MLVAAGSAAPLALGQGRGTLDNLSEKGRAYPQPAFASRPASPRFYPAPNCATTAATTVSTEIPLMQRCGASGQIL